MIFWFVQLKVCGPHCHPGVRLQTGKSTSPPDFHSKLQGIKKHKRRFLNPSFELGFGGVGCPPKSAFQGTLDLGLGGRGGDRTLDLESCYENSLLPPQIRAPGALDVGFAVGRLPPPQIQADDWGLRIFFRGGWLVCPPTRICARGRPGRWIWRREPKMFFCRPKSAWFCR